jgi:hypothetical protein
LVILVETTGGYIFGGYAHCKWPEGDWSGDPSQKSFLFTLKNPGNTSPRRFRMKSGGQNYVLYSWADGRNLVWMGSAGAISLPSDCNRNSNCHTQGFADTTQDCTFLNDSGEDGKTFFTGSETFSVKEVEIFEFFD